MAKPCGARLMVGQAWGVVEVPAVGKLRAHLDADAGGTPRMVVSVGLLEVRYVLPNALLSIEMVHAADRLAAATAVWQESIHEYATSQRVIPAPTDPEAGGIDLLSTGPTMSWGGASCWAG